MEIFLNPGSWPDLPSLFPTIIFVGAAFFSLRYRIQHVMIAARRKKLSGYVTGIFMLIRLYFILFFITEILPTVTGINPFQTNRVGIIYVFLIKSVCYGFKLVFAWGTPVYFSMQNSLDNQCFAALSSRNLESTFYPFPFISTGYKEIGHNSPFTKDGPQGLNAVCTCCGIAKLFRLQK